jgi:hypothetical protein
MDCAHHERLWSYLWGVSLICDNTSAISVAKNPVFHKRMSHLERRHHFLRDHVEKEDIEMRYKIQLPDILTKPLHASSFATLWGEIDVCHPYGLVCGGVGALSSICVSFAFLLHFLHTHISHFASNVILACICLIMLITMLG